MKKEREREPMFIGIDPGQSGGIAIVNNGAAQAFKMPATERDISDLFEQISRAGVRFAVIEKVHSMPKQGVASSFKFGVNYGLLRMALIAHRIPFEEATPQTWQKVMGCLSGGDKNKTKARAQQLFPHLKVIHATADALLLAEYCRRVYGASINGETKRKGENQ